MAKYVDVSKLTDDQKCQLIDNRWKSSSTVWDTVERIYKQNTAIYQNNADWLTNIPYRRQTWRVQSNRIFTDMESVINSLIANPPGINILPAREGVQAQEFASKLENYFRKKYQDRNIKETMRMAYRNLYFSRLMVVKPFWNPTIDDFDFRAVDPRKLRVGKYARKEQDTEFAIEEIEDNLCAVIDRFPNKKKELMSKYGLMDDNDLYIKNPDVNYKEAWVNNHYVICKLDQIILDTIQNPYWDWEGILLTEDEENELKDASPDRRREILQQAKLEQEQRTQPEVQAQETGVPAQTPPQEGQPVPPGAHYIPPVNPQAQPGEQPPPELDDFGNPITPQEPTPPKYRPYMFNYFDEPRKPYIFATIFNNENSPIGRTDMITLCAELQRGIDKRKMDIDENCELVNGMLKVDASVMGKSDAQRIRFETKGIIWGKGVKDGVTRETGSPLPPMVFQDMEDSRSEIDNIMAATSAFKGVQQGVETKGGRLALVQQSYQRLNELVQVGDYVHKEIFEWGMQLAKQRYTEYHYAKWMGKQDASEVIEIIQDDFETGTEIVVTAGTSLPDDDESRFEMAQDFAKAGWLSPIDLLRISKFEDYKRLAKNAFLYKVSPFSQFDITDEERMKIPPPLPASRLTEHIDFKDLPSDAKVQWLGRQGITVTEDQVVNEPDIAPVVVNFQNLPADAQVQMAAKLGLKVDPNVLVAEKLAEHNIKKASVAPTAPTEVAPQQ